VNVSEIIQHFEALDVELVESGFTRKVQVLAIGGFYMLVNVKNRPSTQDIDTWILHPQFYEADYTTLKALIAFVAQDRQLDVDWFNDKVADFLSAAGNQQLPQMFPWQENIRFRILEFYFPKPDYILALKLMAARPKDMGDITELRHICSITSKAQAYTLINTYIAEEVQQFYKIEEKLRRVFGE
jgi:hypothetical protein